MYLHIYRVEVLVVVSTTMEGGLQNAAAAYLASGTRGNYLNDE